jgi:hypothetical protein
MSIQSCCNQNVPANLGCCESNDSKQALAVTLFALGMLALTIGALALMGRNPGADPAMRSLAKGLKTGGAAALVTAGGLSAVIGGIFMCAIDTRPPIGSISQLRRQQAGELWQPARVPNVDVLEEIDEVISPKPKPEPKFDPLEEKTYALEKCLNIQSIEHVNHASSLIEETLPLLKQSLKECYIGFGVLPNEEGNFNVWEADFDTMGDLVFNGELELISTAANCLDAIKLFNIIIMEKAHAFFQSMSFSESELSQEELKKIEQAHKRMGDLLDQSGIYNAAARALEKSMRQLDICKMQYATIGRKIIEQGRVNVPFDVNRMEFARVVLGRAPVAILPNSDIANKFIDHVRKLVDQIIADFHKAVQLAFLHSFSENLVKFSDEDKMVEEGDDNLLESLLHNQSELEDFENQTLSPIMEEMMKTFMLQDIRHNLLPIDFPDRPAINTDLLHL